MRSPKLRFSRRASLAVLAATLTASAAGAATLHRFAIAQTTGSEGAQAVLQTSATGGAFQGEVGGSSANTSIKIPFGLLGEYDAPSTSQFGVGTLGISTTGYGVAGESLGNQPSVLGFAGGQGSGVEGVSNFAMRGVPGSATAGVAGIGTQYANGGNFSAANGYGIFVTSTGGPTAIGAFSSGGIGYLGLSSGEGLEAIGNSGNSTDPVISGTDFAGGSDLLGLYSNVQTGQNEFSNQETFIVQGGSADRSGKTAAYNGASDVQVSGDLYVLGKIYDNCLGFPATSSTDCTDVENANSYGTSSVTRSAAGNDVKVYAPTQGERTVEDFGSARLANGRGFVPLDSAYAATISRQSPYLVFVTPDGDCRGLYVSGKTPAGFTVAELGGGRSSLTFDYRIVAKPLGDTSQRFVAVAPRAKHTIAGYHVSHHPRGFRPGPAFRPAQKIIPPVAVMR
jgi:hypothetical protein